MNQRNDAIEALITQLDRLLAEEAEPQIIGLCLKRLKRLSLHGSYLGNLRRIAPFRDLKSDSAVSQAASRWIQQGRRASLNPNRPADEVTSDHLDLYGCLVAMDALPEPLRSSLLAEKAREQKRSLRTILRWVKAAKTNGPEALRRRRRADRGRCHEPEEVQRFFRCRREEKNTRHETLQLSIDATMRAFPGLDISADALRRLNRRVIKPRIENKEKRRRRYFPSGQWDVPRPNHTWVFDSALGDIVVWDGDPDHEPYRPWLTAIIDECTQSCMWAVYTKEMPSVEVLKGVVLHAMLPKRYPGWPQCGFPLHLHCDNGKVQHSKWLRSVCKLLKTEIGMTVEIRHTTPYSPFQDGHVESFFGITHQRFESQLGACYCGKDRRHPPDCFVEPEGKGPVPGSSILRSMSSMRSSFGGSSGNTTTARSTGG